MTPPDFSVLESDFTRHVDLAYFASAVMHRAVNRLGAITHDAEYLTGFARRRAPEVEPDAARILDTALSTAGLLREFSAHAVLSVPSSTESLDLCELARDVQVRVASIAGRSVGWRLALDEPMPLRGDRLHLGRMLELLLSRAAARAAEGGTTVSVRTHSSQTTSRLVVATDSGPWPSEDEAAALTDAAARDLVIVRAIWRCHFGRVAASDDALGPALELIRPK
jgi:hypothetical protein